MFSQSPASPKFINIGPIKLALVAGLFGLFTGITPGEYVSIRDTVADCKKYRDIVVQWNDLRPREFDNDLDPDLILAIMAQESHCQPHLISGDGWASTGLMQVIPRDWTASKERLLVPRINIYWGMWILDRTLTKYDGDVVKALAVYNCGEPKVEAGLCGPHGGYNYAESVLQWKWWIEYLRVVRVGRKAWLRSVSGEAYIRAHYPPADVQGQPRGEEIGL